ncbi:hypothetical protein D3C84_528360 [compost metagenome]
MDDGAAAGGTGMCRVRRSVRPDEGGEGIREADGLPGEKTFGFMFNKKRVFPKSLAPARRVGETPSRATPSHAIGQSHIPSLRRARDAAMPSQLHIVTLPALRRWAPLPLGDAFPPAASL